jgi:hypothetical protein
MHISPTPYFALKMVLPLKITKEITNHRPTCNKIYMKVLEIKPQIKIPC